MPVLVTGAERPAGRAAVRALAPAGQLRVYLDESRAGPADVASYRHAGCKTATGSMDDEGRIERALEQVHTVAHLHGHVIDEPDRVLDELAVVLSAAIGAGCRRFIWASHLGAEDPQGNPYLEACAEGEELLAAAPLETVIFRCAIGYGPGDALTGALAAGAAAAVAGQPRHAPLHIDDLADAVRAADEMDRHAPVAPELHLLVQLAGPDEVTLDEFAGLLGAPKRPKAAARLPGHVIDLLARDQPRTEAMLGLGGTPLATGVERLPVAS